MTATERSWTESFIWHIRQAPFQLMHMRELVETTVAATDTSTTRVSGGSDPARLPYRVDPADDADQLYAELILFGREVAERIGGASPRPLRERMWHGRHEPQGLPSCTPSEAFSLATEITQWLEAVAHTIAHDPHLHDAPEHLIQTIRKMRARYPRAEPRFKHYRPRPCPICGEKTIEPIYSAEGLAGYRCDSCEASWDHTGTPVEQVNTRDGEGP